jgi:conjugal transfer ATP-binding protein TraC
MEIRIEPTRIVLRTERFRALGQNTDGTPDIGEVARSFRYALLCGPQPAATLDGVGYREADRRSVHRQAAHAVPVATVLALEYPDEQAATARASFKFMRTTSRRSRSARWMPQLKDQSREWEYVQEQLRQGQKLVRVYYGVTSFSPFGKGDAHERNLKAIYKSGVGAAGRALHADPGLLAVMPMTMANGLARDFERLKRMRTMLTTTVANIAPMQGEYAGSPVPHLLLLGRRGQPFFWSPFENAAGNHNVAVFGKSGSGKSVALQEMTARWSAPAPRSSSSTMAAASSTRASCRAASSSSSRCRRASASTRSR